MFGTVLLVAYTALLAYVLWRAASVLPRGRWLSRRIMIGVGASLWVLFLLARLIGHDGRGPAAIMLERVGMPLLGAVFLTAVMLLIVDIGTLFGRVLPHWTKPLRGSALVAGLLLSVFALVQGHRAPAVVSYDVTVSNLPRELDGRVLVALSDAHLGSQLDERWFSQRLGEVQALDPDIIVFLGDVFEGHGNATRDIPALRQLAAPLGKWFVRGNHESPRRDRASSELLERSGFRLLENRWARPAPGLLLAGVSDLSHHQRRGLAGDPLALALANRPEDATVLLSHTPWQAERAAQARVALMLSGHTHGGQIWPFGYLVQTVYPLLAGRYDVDGMTVIVSRGIGTWGPRMRLWRRSEIVRVVLRAG